MADATGAGRIPGVGMPPDSRPNIILILVDDMGFAVLGIMGSEIPPPYRWRGAGREKPGLPVWCASMMAGQRRRG